MHFFLRYCEESSTILSICTLCCAAISLPCLWISPLNVISHAPAAAEFSRISVGVNFKQIKNLNDNHKAIALHFLQHLQDFFDGERGGGVLYRAQTAKANFF